MHILDYSSPNYDSRDGAQVDMLVLHYTGMQTGQEALTRLCDPAAKVSAHYLVEEDGRVFRLIQESKRAWHARVASWGGKRNINARSIGIEIVNPGHEFGYRPFTEAQMQSLVVLCREILARYKIPAHHIVAHSDVAPVRKQDPGELFDWERLAEQGIGLFPPESLMTFEKAYNRDDLAAYGYSCQDASDEQLVTAFQRHFRPGQVNGIWDHDCAARLQWLLEKISHSV